MVEYEVRYIVESMNISVDVGRVLGSGQLNLTVIPLDKNDKQMGDDPRGATIKVDEIINLDDNSYIPTGDSPEDLTETSFRKEYPTYTQSGNYSITVTIENSRLNPNSGSPYLSITNTWNGPLNILPVAFASYQIVEEDIISYTVKFDASLSWNDGPINLYKWDFNQDGDFDDAGEQTTDPIVEKTFTRGISPDVILNVEGDVMLWDPFDKEYYPETGFYEIEVTSP